MLEWALLGLSGVTFAGKLYNFADCYKTFEWA